MARLVDEGDDICWAPRARVRAFSIGAALKAAAGQIVDAKDAYLIPGLWDMHLVAEGELRVVD